ncbi:terminase large subunit [Mycobacterium phage Gancho]|uniref:Terminase large subunit n=1 Tax=Mycobacterium phage Gancho TaxID=2301613 RepID=A0A385UJL6_9CAUD|nr:terminase large subunit [Mycobacterium phage Gancho]
MSTTTISRAEAAGVATKPHRGTKIAQSEDMWPWWVSEPPRLTGNPKPAWEHYDDTADFSIGDRLGRFAHKIEEALFGWQWDAARKIMATRPDGLWAHPDVCLIIPRQNGKTQLIALRIIYGLFFLGEKIVYTAQRWQTVKDVYDRIVEIIKRRPSLLRRLKPMPGVPDGYSEAGQHGEIYTTNGGSLDMGPRTKAVGRGQTKIDLAIFDEAYDIKDVLVGGLTGAQKAATNPQTIYISTAAVASEHPDCGVLAGMRRNGQRKEPDLYAAEWCAPPGMARDDPEAWRLACPSFGITVRERDLAREYRMARANARLLAIYDADYLGWGEWPPDPENTEPIIDPDWWEALTVLQPALVGDICIAIERTLDTRYWCIAAGQRTIDGRVHVEVGYWRAANIGVVAAALLELVELWNPAAIIVDDRSKAKPIVGVMFNQGIEIETASTPKLAMYTQGFIDAVNAADVTHVGQKIITDGIAGAAMRELPRGDLVFDEKESGAPVAPLKAIALAHGAVLEYAAEPQPAASPDTGTDAGPVDLDDVSVLEASF